MTQAFGRGGGQVDGRRRIANGKGNASEDVAVTVDKKTKEASGCVDSISEVTESPGDCRAA